MSATEFCVQVGDWICQSINPPRLHSGRQSRPGFIARYVCILCFLAAAGGSQNFLSPCLEGSTTGILYFAKTRSSCHVKHNIRNPSFGHNRRQIFRTPPARLVTSSTNHFHRSKSFGGRSSRVHVWGSGVQWTRPNDHDRSQFGQSTLCNLLRSHQQAFALVAPLMSPRKTAVPHVEPPGLAGPGLEDTINTIKLCMVGVRDHWCYDYKCRP